MPYRALTTMLLALATFLLPAAAVGTTATPSCACTPTLVATPLPTLIGPRITAEPAAHTLACNGSFTIRISNSGSPGATLVINTLDIANGYEQGYYGLGFSWDDSAIHLPASLPSGATLQIPVTYSATGSFPSLLHVTIDSNATNSPHLFLTYFGLLCASPTPTSTPPRPGDLGYKGVDGIVYDAAVGLNLPIAGAQVDYTHSSLVNPGGTGTAITDAQGRFGLFLFLHDTDTVVVQAQAAGFRPRSVQFSGLQLWFDVQRVDLGLEPVLTHTVTPTPTSTSTPGPTWSNVGPPGIQINALAIDPQTPTTLYAGGGSIYKSTDGGASWYVANAGVTSLQVASLAIDPLTPTTLYAGTSTNYGRHNGGVFKSTDAGGHWRAINDGLGNSSFSPSVPVVVTDPVAPDTVYALIAGGGDPDAYGIAKTTDGGTSWHSALNGLEGSVVRALAIDPATSTTLYVGTDSGVFRSTDGAASWQPASVGLTVEDVRSLAVAPAMPAFLFAGTTAGVFKSSDSAASWEPASNGLHDSLGDSLVIPALAIDPATSTTVFAGTAAGVFKSTDGGGQWSPSLYPDVAILAIDPTTPRTVYAGGTGVFKSTNGGESWQSTMDDPLNGAPTVFALIRDPAGPNLFYADTYPDGLLKSTDGTHSWSVLTSGLPGLQTLRAPVLDPSTPATVYASGELGVLKSTDGGTSWKTTGLAGAAPLAVDPTNPMTVYATRNPGLYKSTDGGISWIAADDGLPNVILKTFLVDPTTPATLYLGTENIFGEGHGVFRSTDGGASWNVLGSGLPYADVAQIVLDPETPTTVYAATGGGLFAIQQPSPAELPTRTSTSTSTPTASPILTATPTPTSTATPITPTPTQRTCPAATAVPVWIDPVTSPTGSLSQRLTVHVSNGERVEVQSESGTFVVTGNFALSPATVDITLLPNTLHHLRVSVMVRPVLTVDGCVYGGYTVNTDVDRFGVPLIIDQQTDSTPAQAANPPPVQKGGGCAVTRSDPHLALDLIFLGLPGFLLRRRIRPVGNRLSKEGLP